MLDAIRNPGMRIQSKGLRRTVLVACAAAALILLGIPRVLFSNQGLSKEARIDLIRALTSEIAVTKITLPRGKHGVILDSKGVLDTAEADKEMHRNGPAILPGMPVEITKLKFKSKRIVFEINGGGKRGKKWYQRIEIGVGTQTTPIAKQPPVLTYGSWITLRLPADSENLSVNRVKQLLANALDFTRHSPTVLYARTTPPEFKEAIEKHQVLVGMDRDTVLSSKGPPDRKVREERPDGTEEEDWIYGLPPHVLYVVFEGDTVTRVHQY
jgi:hypothetical protein